ncbi:uncharacterized protein LOC110820713, partial [Carica papaya]|uniref:uncharacterized protein LOC110820713 n=1 Tax=Carica papaya TaxID=3649 RepID=UPI000B8D1106
MGKRKERRLAALNNAGRRVKLDLFVEPSGELGGSIVHEEVGGDPKDTAVLPNSPSSSGEPPENPLLLLGQYSDDDVDEELDKGLNHAIITESPSVLNDAQVEELPAEGCKEMDADIDESIAAQKVGQQHIERDSVLQHVYSRQEDDDTKETDAAGLDDSCKEMHHAPQNFAPGISEVQITGEVSSSWKMVMHEETNQYYYWNTETGETSWEIPAFFAQSTESTLDCKSPLTRNVESASVGTHNTGSGLGDELDNSSAAQSNSLVCTNLITQSEVDGNGPQTADLAGEYKTEALKDKNLVPKASKIEIQSSLDTINVVSNNSVNDDLASNRDKTGIDLSTYLVTRSESLLERLKSLKGSQGNSQAHGWLSKYMLEVEIRLSDFTALLSHGSSLLPFWVHSEKQLKRLEEAINDEIYQLAKSAVMDEVEETHMSASIGKHKSHESSSAGNEANGIDVNQQDHSYPTAGNPLVVLNDDSTVLPPLDEEWIPPTPTDNEQIPPPPPDNEQIPPPPPDNDQVPPPPSDELQEPSYPPLPSYMETGQPVTYAEQYCLAYSDPNIQYYGHSVADVSSSNFYGHADGSQVAVPDASLYYGIVPNTYGETANAMVNTVQAVAYYDFKTGGVLPATVDGNAESLQFQKDSAPVSYNVVTLGSADSTAITMKVNVSTADGGDVVAATIPCTSATIQAPATVSVKDSVSSESTNVIITSAAGTSSSAKVQSKVLRGKKRTVPVAPSLRSNKRVSGLVDKWKAAKEELNEIEDDEPENLYEILEKKRQREIEEWHAKQIASGEARGNANFQPLGGDWRERVKRRRAQAAAKETAEIAPEVRSNETQQPDLAEFSKGLPSGWQAYWDETSKQVYYGNAMTSETT